MATRINAKPDSDGIIRVICGGELLEIMVDPGNVMATQPRRPDDPFGNPTAMIVATGPYGQIDLEAVISRLHQEIDAAGSPAPEVVVLRANVIDLRGVASLTGEMIKEGHDIALAFDLSETGAATSTAAARDQA